MANWLGINVYGYPIADANTAEICGYLPEPTAEMPVGSPAFRTAVDKQYNCITSAIDLSTAKAESKQDLVDSLVMIGTIGLPIVFLLLFGRKMLRGLDGLMVNSAAGAIKAKRSADAYARDVKTRIAEKANEQ